MNAIQQDKCFARRIARAGCVNALGIVRVRHAAESTRVASNAERMLAWRNRANEPGRGNPLFVRKWNVTVPQPLNASLSRDSATTPPPEVAARRAGAILKETS